jgi:hypothetical protein
MRPFAKFKTKTWPKCKQKRFVERAFANANGSTENATTNAFFSIYKTKLFALSLSFVKLTVLASVLFQHEAA